MYKEICCVGKILSTNMNVWKAQNKMFGHRFVLNISFKASNSADNYRFFNRLFMHQKQVFGTDTYKQGNKACFRSAYNQVIALTGCRGGSSSLLRLLLMTIVYAISVSCLALMLLRYWIIGWLECCVQWTMGWGQSLTARFMEPKWGPSGVDR